MYLAPRSNTRFPLRERDLIRLINFINNLDEKYLLDVTIHHNPEYLDDGRT